VIYRASILRLILFEEILKLSKKVDALAEAFFSVVLGKSASVSLRMNTRCHVNWVGGAYGARGHLNRDCPRVAQFIYDVQ
jgi:hypothetical protein